MSMPTTKPARWRVERAGAPGGSGYARGWLAMSSNGVGVYCTSWQKALDIANRESSTEFVRWQLALAGLAEDAIGRILMQDVHASRASRRGAGRA